MNLDSSIIMRHFFHARQEMHPAPPDLRLERPSLLPQEHHHRCYRQWQRTFQVNQLYREVRNEVREMHDYLMLRRTQRLELVGPSGRSSSKGTRITVSVVFDNLVEELTPEAIVAEYVPPTLNEVRAEMA